MGVSRRNLGVLLLLGSFATGCGLNSAILQKGGNGRKGVLLCRGGPSVPCTPNP